MPIAEAFVEIQLALDQLLVYYNNEQSDQGKICSEGTPLHTKLVAQQKMG